MSNGDAHQAEVGRSWFAVERRVFEDPMFAGERFSRRDLWLWLVAHAAIRDHTVMTRAGVMKVKRGQVIVGRDYLAKVSGWTPKQVRTFLQQLVKAERIKLSQSMGHNPLVATICNYEKYQPRSGHKGPVAVQWGDGRGPHNNNRQGTKNNTARSRDRAQYSPEAPKNIEPDWANDKKGLFDDV